MHILMLWEALLNTLRTELFSDTSRFKQCADELCREAFFADRVDKKYCDRNCQMRKLMREKRMKERHRKSRIRRTSSGRSKV